MVLAALIAVGRAAGPEHDVLVLHDVDPALVEGVRGRLMAPGLLRDTDPWDLAVAGIPSVATLDGYDAVLVWLDQPALDAELLGDRLAEYVDLHHGGVVLAGGSCASANQPSGRWTDDGLPPWAGGVLESSLAQRALPVGPDHDLHGALGVLDAGSSPRCVGLLPLGPAPLVWDDGVPLVALHPSLRIAGVDLWPPDDTADPDGWLADGQGDQVLVRALLWAAGWDWPDTGCRRQTPEADRNCNGILRSDELPVDLSEPVCAENPGADGLPLPSLDDYVEPFAYGCLLPVRATNDIDGDGLSDGGVELVVHDHVWASWTLICDGCPDIPDPLRFDLDCDSDGDLCDRCPFSFGDGGPDEDQDGIPLDCDNCPVPNPTQDDADHDGVGDACDLCPNIADPRQDDGDGDALGDRCDPCPALFGDAADADGDGFGDRCDLCPGTPDPAQTDVDLDGIGDACDLCPLQSDDQTDSDGDGRGDRCDGCPLLPGPPGDRDGDGVDDLCDPCPDLWNENPVDRDSDGLPDVCDRCPQVADPAQRDRDGDGFGDRCDVCPDTPGATQVDADGDGVGDQCDRSVLRGGGGGCDTGPAGQQPWILPLAVLFASVARYRGFPWVPVVFGEKWSDIAIRSAALTPVTSAALRAIDPDERQVAKAASSRIPGPSRTTREEPFPVEVRNRDIDRREVLGQRKRSDLFRGLLRR